MGLAVAAGADTGTPGIVYNETFSGLASELRFMAAVCLPVDEKVVLENAMESGIWGPAFRFRSTLIQFLIQLVVVNYPGPQVCP